MFARKATFQAIDRVHGMAPVGRAHSNDNHLHPMAGAPPALRLVCHWHIAPATGKPQCHWRSECDWPAPPDGERKPRPPRLDPAR